MNESIRLETPCEVLNITPLNPLISKCEIKVCWVGEDPNRNKSIITKEVATQMANSLPGSPIVGYYNEATGDFEEHNKVFEIANGQIKMSSKTRPYGFVDLNAKVWFQKYKDKDDVEREYLVTEGYLWTGQYPEAKRIIEKGNHQSMELDENLIDAYWTKDEKGKPQFFIINEAIISKLCILGENVEPCFEGANITAPVTFSLEEDFKVKIYSMMEEIKDLLQKGGLSVINTYAVEIGDALWSTINEYLKNTYGTDVTESDGYTWRRSEYWIRGIYEEAGQKFVIIESRENNALYRMNFTINADDTITYSEDLTQVELTYIPVEAAQFTLEQYEEDERLYKEACFAAAQAAAEPVAEPTPEDEPVGEPVVEEPEIEPAIEEPITEPASEPVEYELEKIPEYVQLSKDYLALQTELETLRTNYTALDVEIKALREFKLQAERKDKEEMITSFWMLSDDDKKDVIENIDSYSLNDIEAKLSIICVRNKVNLTPETNTVTTSAPTVYNLNTVVEEDNAPSWIKAVRSVAKERK